MVKVMFNIYIYDYRSISISNLITDVVLFNKRGTLRLSYLIVARLRKKERVVGLIGGTSNSSNKQAVTELSLVLTISRLHNGTSRSNG